MLAQQGVLQVKPWPVAAQEQIVGAPGPAEQLKLVSDFSWINFDRLTAVKELITSVLTTVKSNWYI